MPPSCDLLPYAMLRPRSQTHTAMQEGSGGRQDQLDLQERIEYSREAFRWSGIDHRSRYRAMPRRRPMTIVDTHCHALPHWFEPVEVLLHQMNANGVEKATLVQVRGQFDNRYIMECVRRFPGRFSAVVIVDTDRPDAPETLGRWVHEGAEGVRLSPTVRSPGGDPLAVWRKAAELGLPVSCLGSPAGFTSPQFEQVVKEFPNLPLIIEHLGGIGRDEAAPYPMFRKM